VPVCRHLARLHKANFIPSLIHTVCSLRSPLSSNAFSFTLSTLNEAATHRSSVKRQLNYNGDEQTRKKPRSKKKSSVHYWQLSTLSSGNFDFKRLTERQQIAFAKKKSGTPEDDLLKCSPFRLDQMALGEGGRAKREKKSQRKDAECSDSEPLRSDCISEIGCEFTGSDIPCQQGTCFEDTVEIGDSKDDKGTDDLSCMDSSLTADKETCVKVADYVINEAIKVPFLILISS
jgi:hypothetical protein